jgi:hypothetical protein
MSVAVEVVLMLLVVLVPGWLHHIDGRGRSPTEGPCQDPL